MQWILTLAIRSDREPTALRTNYRRMVLGCKAGTILIQVSSAVFDRDILIHLSNRHMPTKSHTHANSFHISSVCMLAC